MRFRQVAQLWWHWHRPRANPPSARCCGLECLAPGANKRLSDLRVQGLHVMIIYGVLLMYAPGFIELLTSTELQMYNFQSCGRSWLCCLPPASCSMNGKDKLRELPSLL